MAGVIMLRTGRLICAVACCAMFGCGLDLPEVREKAGTGGSASGGGGTGAVTTGGAGGGSGAGGSGAGGGSGCVDVVDIPPVKVKAATFGLTVAATAGSFGVLESSSFSTLSGGSVTSETPMVTFGKPSVTATSAGYVVPTRESSEFRISRFGPSGAPLGTTGKIDNETVHSLVVGAADRALVTWIAGASLWSAILQDGQNSPSTPVDHGHVDCCASRRWAAAPTAGGFGVLRADDWASPMGVYFRSVDSSGTLGPNVSRPEFGLTFIPEWGVPLGSNLVFGDCSMWMEVSPTGAAVQTGKLPGAGSCAVASTGVRLRMAVPGASAIEWRDVTPGAAGAVMLSIPASTSRVSVAWDGKGFGLVWNAELDNALWFAHVQLCSM